MERARRARRTILLAALLGGLAFARPTFAQQDPIGDLFTTTTTAPKRSAPKASTTSTSTTAPPSSVPAGSKDTGGDGVAAPAGGIVVPPEAQRIISAVKRTPPSDDQVLVEGVARLQSLGASAEEAYRLAMGRFPVAGPARWVHDWLYPRYGPGFRFHLGCDVVAAFGTPVRAPVDGIVTSSEDPLGGLTARVTMPDGTRFAFAHLSGLAEGMPGRTVQVGDVIGFVGDSGNAKGGTAHVHVAIYPRGGAATDPKPVLDRFLHEAEAALPEVVASYAAAHPTSSRIPVPLLPASADARLLRPALSTGLLAPWAAGESAWTPTRLFVLASDPALGAGYLLQSSLEELAAEIDWLGRSKP